MDITPAFALGHAHILVRQSDSGDRMVIPFNLGCVILFPTLWANWSVDMTYTGWSLGCFGDRRLDKGGRRCSKPWYCVRACACAGWAVVGARKRFVSADTWRIARLRSDA
jgi:hypothetical protein